MVVDPWGVVLAQAPDTEGFVSADLDFAAQDNVRERLPSLRHRRPETYEWSETITAGVS
jgi:predicted amidohydrolase